MRARELVMFAALAGAIGCVDNPDPRHPTIQKMEREGFGAFIVITTQAGQEISGELISVESNVIRVLRFGPVRGALTWVATTDVRSAQLFRYESESGLGPWALLGTLSTITHGFFLILSAPVWILTGSLAAGAESRHVVMEFPESSWSEIGDWARFPQGMPPGLDEHDLTWPRARRTPHPRPPVGERTRTDVQVTPEQSTPGVKPVILSPEQAQLEARRQAWELTKKAQAAARKDDCGAVLTLSGQVQTVDLDFYDSTFVTDAAIRRCLGLAPATPPAR
ncbi:MAG: hypothetical protein IPQ07_11255 [Myxococcales bacterium]|nr:hypothetical protein [Myxococcales bacterium]